MTKGMHAFLGKRVQGKNKMKERAVRPLGQLELYSYGMKMRVVYSSDLRVFSGNV